MVDADSTVGLLPMKAALEVKKRYADRIKFDVGVQPLQGVLDPASYEQFAEACAMADFCGALPSRDRPTPEKHLDVVLSLAKKLGKCVDVHIDQENNPLENETELLARKTIEHGMQGKVFGVHAISLSAKEEREQDRIIELVKEADMGIIICPSAALCMKQLPMMGPLHNSIAPFVKLQRGGRAHLSRRRQHPRPVHADGRRRHLDRMPDDDGGLPLLRHRRGRRMGLQKASRLQGRNRNRRQRRAVAPARGVALGCHPRA